MAEKSVGHLKVSGAEGESEVEGHQKEIKINGWGFGGNAASTVGSSGGSSAPGRVSMGPIWVVADMDEGAGKLLKFMYEGDHSAKAELSVERIGSDKKLTKIELEEAYVSSWSVTHENKNNLPQVQITFTYKEIKYQYFKQTDKGTTTSTGPVTYSVVQNKIS